MSKAKDRGAVLQFEIDRRHWFGIHKDDISRESSLENMLGRLHHIARTAISDCLRNGGTFVLVASPNTVTMVQRPDAETFDEPTPEQTK